MSTELPKQPLCQWCQENTFDLLTLRILKKACDGERHRDLVKHTLSKEPFYFWTSQPYHSGYGRTFHRRFQSVQKDAEKGCIFCSLLVTAVRKSPPKDPNECYFKGPLRTFPEIRDTIKSNNDSRGQAASRLKEYRDHLDPNWAQHSTYAEVVQGAIKAGLPPESQLLAFKTGHGNHVSKDDAASKRSGCLSCLPYVACWSRLKAALTPRQDFAFTVLINEPWEYATVCWPYKPQGSDFGVEFSNCYFRLYPTEPRKDWMEIATTTLEDGVLPHEQMWDEGDSLSSGKSLSRDGKNFRSLMEECIAHHKTCTPRAEGTLPSRLLRLSGTILSPTMQLVDVKSIPTSPILYACLSYCWGGPQPGQTTTARVAIYSKDIDFAEMPRTIQDAAKVTLSLGLEYLWVDSYCIVQDSEHDKIIELAKMSSIYNAAYCTIAAMSATAASEGFLPSDEPIMEYTPTTWHVDIDNSTLQHTLGRSSPRCAILEMRSDFTKPALHEEPLVTRAWTLQEALLSPRLLMFFSAGQRPALRCASRIMRSDGGIIPRIPQELNTLRVAGELDDGLNSTQSANGSAEEHASGRASEIVEEAEPKEEHASHTASNIGQDAEPSGRDLAHGASLRWHTIVTEYTKRVVTNPTDRMLALMGIVAEIEFDRSLGTYLAGMWSKTLKRDLLWEVGHRDPMFGVSQETGRRSAHNDYIGPSWSWVSRDHPVYYSSDFDEEDRCLVRACDIVPRDSSLPNGIIKSARLTIYCPSKEVDVSDDWKDGERGFYFDDNPRPLGVGKMWLLKVMAEEPYNTSYSVGLGVVEAEGSCNSQGQLYKRIGMYLKGAGEGTDFETNDWPKHEFTLI